MASQTSTNDALPTKKIVVKLKQPVVNINVDKKKGLIDSLEKLHKKEVASKETWKAKAYLKVINQLKAKDGPVHNFDDLKDVNGVGKGLKDKIVEYLETGAMHQLIDYNADGSIKIITDLMKVHGIGAVKAKELVEKHGIQSVNDLKTRSELLNDIQKLGLKYCEDFEKRIPRTEMEKHEIHIINVVKSIDPKLIVTLTGSYRRQLPDSGDVDVLITHPDDPEDFKPIFTAIIEKLQTVNKGHAYIKDLFALGIKKCMAVCKLPRYKTSRRIDLMYTRKHEYPFALMYFTGSGDFNVRLRNLALSKGYSLSEYGLKYVKGENKGGFVEHQFESEKDIFVYLGLCYIEPQNRVPHAIDVMVS